MEETVITDEAGRGLHARIWYCMQPPLARERLQRLFYRAEYRELGLVAMERTSDTVSVIMEHALHPHGETFFHANI